MASLMFLNGYAIPRTDWCRFCGLYCDGLLTNAYGFKCSGCREKDWIEVKLRYGLVTADEILESHNGLGRD